MIKVILIGLLAGYFSGHFGLGGGLITTPAIRLWLNQPAFIAVGTPLLVNIPTAIAGAVSYGRRGYVEKTVVLPLAGAGMVGAVLGAAATSLVDGSLILLLTGVIIFGLSWRFILGRDVLRPAPRTLGVPALAVAGLAIGFFSGFLGLGGGFLLVPFLSLVLRLDIKTTFGTSLTVIGAVTIPGALVHYYLGHIDVQLGLLLALGVIPGAVAGSKVAMRLPNPLLKMMFGATLALLAVYLSYNELVALA